MQARAHAARFQSVAPLFTLVIESSRMKAFGIDSWQMIIGMIIGTEYTWHIIVRIQWETMAGNFG